MTEIGHPDYYKDHLLESIGCVADRRALKQALTEFDFYKPDWDSLAMLIDRYERLKRANPSNDERRS